MTPAIGQNPSPVRFFGVKDVKRNLFRAAQAVSNFEQTRDRFNLGLAHGFAAAALSDPAFKQVAAKPDALMDEKINVPGEGKTSLREVLVNKGILGTLHEVLIQNMLAATPERAKTLSVDIPIRDPQKMLAAFGQDPSGVLERLMGILTDNAFAANGPVGETRVLIDGMKESLERQISPMRMLDSLPSASPFTATDLSEWD